MDKKVGCGELAQSPKYFYLPACERDRVNINGGKRFFAKQSALRVRVNRL
jgi:hypothetical protein